MTSLGIAGFLGCGWGSDEIVLRRNVALCTGPPGEQSFWLQGSEGKLGNVLPDLVLSSPRVFPTAAKSEVSLCECEVPGQLHLGPANLFLQHRGGFLCVPHGAGTGTC